MSSRARLFAAVTLLVSCLAGPATRAQAQNLEAGKSPSQLFASACNECHKNPRGLLKTVSAGSLPGFLKEHYTTGGEMASQLSAYLISNGAGDKRQAKQSGGNDQGDRQNRKLRNAPPQEGARSDADNPPQGENGWQERKRFVRPSQGTEEVRPTPTINEPPRAALGMSDPAKRESGKEVGAASERTNPDGENRSNETKSGGAKSNEAKSEAAGTEPPRDVSSGEKPVVRPEPVSPVTPVVPSVAVTSPPKASVAPETPASAPKATAAAPAPPAVAASAPPSPSGRSPVPPISQ
jgi:hypothetical protein